MSLTALSIYFGGQGVEYLHMWRIVSSALQEVFSANVSHVTLLYILMGARKGLLCSPHIPLAGASFQCESFPFSNRAGLVIASQHY